MQRFFAGLLCFSVLLMLCGCATFKGDSSSMGREPASQAETKAASPIPGMTETTATASIPGTAQTCPVGSVACPPPVPREKAVPIVEVPEKSFDFGIMKEDRDYSHKFVIKNVGTSELIIKKILPG